MNSLDNANYRPSITGVILQLIGTYWDTGQMISLAAGVSSIEPDAALMLGSVKGGQA
jgi:hypothetical protein